MTCSSSLSTFSTSTTSSSSAQVTLPQGEDLPLLTPSPLACASDADQLHGTGSTTDAEAGKSHARLHSTTSGGHAFLARRAEQREKQGRRELVWAPRESVELLQGQAALPTRDPYPHRHRVQTQHFVQDPPRARTRQQPEPALQTASRDASEPSAGRRSAAPLYAAFGSARARRSRSGVRPGPSTLLRPLADQATADRFVADTQGFDTALRAADPATVDQLVPDASGDDDEVVCDLNLILAEIDDALDDEGSVCPGYLVWWGGRDPGPGKVPYGHVECNAPLATISLSYGYFKAKGDSSRLEAFEERIRQQVQVQYEFYAGPNTL